MPGDQFSRTVVVASDRDRCWEVLTNVDTLASWIGIVHSIVEIEALAHYSALLEDRVGPIKLKAPLDVHVDVLAMSERVKIAASGIDPQVNSQIIIDASVDLADETGGTRIAISGSYQVLGRVASMGGGIIRKKAEKIMDEFFANAESSLGALSAGSARA